MPNPPKKSAQETITYSGETFLVSMTIRPARIAVSDSGLVRMTRILHTVRTMEASYRHDNTTGRSLCATTFQSLSKIEMGRYWSSSRRRARCRSCNQFRQSVTGTMRSASWWWWSPSSPSSGADTAVPITPHTSRSSLMTSFSTAMRLEKEEGITLPSGVTVPAFFFLGWPVPAVVVDDEDAGVGRPAAG
jgi:hypothetical protein